MPRRTALCVLGIAALVTVFGPPAGAAPSARATVSVSPTTAAPGEQVLVSATGMPAGAPSSIMFCGRAAVGGTSDCNTTARSAATANANGAFSVAVKVAAPPKPCPCVVLISTPRIQQQLTTPISISGMATVKPPEIVSATLGGWGPLSAWFGGDARRTLNLTVKNPNTRPQTLSNLVVSGGHGSTANIQLGTLQPGETKTWTVPVRLGTLAHGKYKVDGQFNADGSTVTFKAGSSAFPWGLLLLGLLAVQFGLLRVRNAARRRFGAERVARPTSAPGAASPRDDVPGRPVAVRVRRLAAETADTIKHALVQYRTKVKQWQAKGIRPAPATLPTEQARRLRRLGGNNGAATTTNGARTKSATPRRPRPLHALGRSTSPTPAHANGRRRPAPELPDDQVTVVDLRQRPQVAIGNSAPHVDATALERLVDVDILKYWGAPAMRKPRRARQKAPKPAIVDLRDGARAVTGPAHKEAERTDAQYDEFEGVVVTQRRVVHRRERSTAGVGTFEDLDDVDVLKYWVTDLYNGRVKPRSPQESDHSNGALTKH